LTKERICKIAKRNGESIHLHILLPFKRRGEYSLQSSAAVGGSSTTREINTSE
jgi:hypothetical protein